MMTRFPFNPATSHYVPVKISKLIQLLIWLKLYNARTLRNSAQELNFYLWIVRGPRMESSNGEPWYIDPDQKNTPRFSTSTIVEFKFSYGEDESITNLRTATVMPASTSNLQRLKTFKNKIVSVIEIVDRECMRESEEDVRRRRLVRGVETSGREDRLIFSGKKKIKNNRKIVEAIAQIQNM